MSDTDVAAYRANGVKWERAAADCAQERRMLRQALTEARPHIWQGRIEQALAIIDAALGEKNDGA